VYGAADLEGHLGLDGRHYVLGNLYIFLSNYRTEYNILQTSLGCFLHRAPVKIVRSGTFRSYFVCIFKHLCQRSR